MLEKGERSILAYFSSSADAERALQELKKAGIPVDEGSISIDRISRYDVRINNEINNPINNATTISGPVLYSSSSGGGGPSPLLAASVQSAVWEIRMPVQPEGQVSYLRLLLRKKRLKRLLR